MNDRISPDSEALCEKIATVLLEQRGFGFYSDPMEGGQDAYDITQEALRAAAAVIAVLPQSAAPELPWWSAEKTAEHFFGAAPAQCSAGVKPANGRNTSPRSTKILSKRRQEIY